MKKNNQMFNEKQPKDLGSIGVIPVSALKGSDADLAYPDGSLAEQFGAETKGADADQTKNELLYQMPQKLATDIHNLSQQTSHDNQLLQHLHEHLQYTIGFLSGLSADQLKYRYANNKWTIKEIIVHIIDTERIYGYRLLCFARNDQTPLPGFDDEAYVLQSGANERSLSSLLDELRATREATIQLLKGLTPQAFMRHGIFNKLPGTVRALAYHIAGHELHHLDVIKTRYLNINRE